MLRLFARKRLETDLKKKIAAFTSCDFGGETVTEDLMAAAGKSYPAPPFVPKRGQHPRVLFNAGEITGIRAAQNDPRNAVAVSLFRELVANPTDGDFGVAEKKNDKFHNFKEDVPKNTPRTATVFRGFARSTR